jgi:iron complex outermembrane receptor protein
MNPPMRGLDMNPTLRKSFRSALLLGAASLSSLALAQSAAAQEMATETVVVTGTHIAGTNVASDLVTSISAADIANTSATSVVSLLKNSSLVSGDITDATTNNGGYGTETVSLRGLGSERTLVLIDGFRGVSGGGFAEKGGTGSAVDLSSIPFGMVDHIEVYKDGASAVYGSDAVAGVVNVVLKKDFTGIEANVTSGVSQHGDGVKWGVDTTIGLADDRGHVIFGIGYLNQQSISQADRKFSSCALQENSPGVKGCVGSYFAQGGYAFALDGATPHNFGPPWNSSALTWHDGPGVGRAFNFPEGNDPGDTFNYAARSLLLQPSKRVNVSGSGEYQLGWGISAFAEGYFSSRESHSELAADPGGAAPGSSIQGLLVPATNPYNPTGRDLYDYRRNIEFGNRVYDTNVQTFRLVGGFKGDFGDLAPTWTWQISTLYGRSTSTQTEGPLLLSGNENIAADPAQCAATFLCAQAAANAGQAALNPFGPSTIAAGWLPYISANLHDTSQNTITMYMANASGDVYDLPAGPIKGSLGMEYRKENASYSPDYLKTTGLTDETANSTSGGYYSYEGYGEAIIPILKDAPFAKDLTVDLAGRVSGYSNTGVNTTYKAQINWAPNDWLKFHALSSTAYRVPSVNDLYSGSLLSYEFANDPCTNWGTSAVPGSNRAQNCASQGVPANFKGAIAGQIPTTFQSNPDLKPEQAHTYNIGAVVTPTSLPGFSFSVDYYYYKITSYIDNLDTSQLLDLCYDGPVGLTSPYCALNGGRSPIGQIIGNTNPYLNLNYLFTDGVDLGVNYNTDQLGPGTLGFKADATYMSDWQQSPTPGIETQNAGTTYQGHIYAHWRAEFGVTYDLDWWGVGLNEHMVGSANDVLPSDVGNVYNQVPTVWTTDLVGHVQFDKWLLTVGVDNVGDTQPPFFDNFTDENTDATSYDVIGRYFWMKGTVKF